MTRIDGIGSMGMAALFAHLGAKDDEIGECVAVLKRDFPGPATYDQIMSEARASLARVRAAGQTVDADPEPKPVEDGGPAPVAGVIVSPVADPT